MDIFFYQAECGDAARIRYIGLDKKPHNIFIDAGYERTFRHVLSEEIRLIKNAGEVIDLWIISHIHDDHIGGAIAYINAIQDGELPDIVHSWYYNPPRAAPLAFKSPKVGLISIAKSITQGDSLASYLIAKDKLPDNDITSSLPTVDFFGLKLTILSPSIAQLQKLRRKYPVASDKALEQSEITLISDAKSIPNSDYHIPIKSFDLKNWKEDDSIENGSSIAILTEFQNKKILWLADAQPNVIIKSLKKLGYSTNNPVVCDWVKVTHHGSKGNNSNELYEMIQCDNYLMSVNGENIHYLPTKECIARILRSTIRKKRQYNLYFTYDSATLRNIFKIDGDDVFKDFNFTVNYLPGIEKMIKVVS